jgi:hypothetical protein
MIYIGIDNGVSGSIAVLDNSGKVLLFEQTPIKSERNYTKEEHFLNRLDHAKLKELFFLVFKLNDNSTENIKIYIERPMVNPMRWKASMSAIRCLESLLVVLEQLKLDKSYEYIDSKEWQKAMLPKSVIKKGSEKLKKSGIRVSKKLFPSVKITTDADALLIAEYYRKKIYKRRVL